MDGKRREIEPIVTCADCNRDFMTKRGFKRHRCVDVRCGQCGRKMDDDYGKAIGCAGCDSVFCSSDCAEAHEKQSQHSEIANR